MTRVVNIDSLLLADKRLLMKGKLVGYVYIGRGHGSGCEWGNPFSHLRSSIAGVVLVKNREEAVRRFEETLLADAERMKRVKAELKGKTLVCWCKPLACHGDVLAWIADAEVSA